MQGWINLFESLYDNTTLNTLNCSDAHLTELKPNNDVAKSVWLEQLVNEIEELETDTDKEYNITSDIN